MATQSEMYSLAIAQGLTPARARVMAAVGQAESGGNPNEHNTNASTGDDSYGLWQINMLGRLKAERLVLFGITSPDQLFDPQTNARAMRVLSADGADPTPWSAYKSGAYKEFLTVPVTDETKDPAWKELLKTISPAYAVATTDNPISTAAQGVGAFVDIGNKTARWVSNSENWVRVGYVVGGSAMVLVGLVMMLQSSSLGSAVSTVLPAGRAVNLAKKVAS